LNLSQAFNSLGTTLAPVFGSALILAATTAATTAQEKADAIRMPYWLLTAALVGLAGVIAAFRLPNIEGMSEAAGQKSGKSAWSFPQLSWGALGIFTYVGGEVSIGSFLVNYLADPSIAGLDHASAGHYVAFYWGGAMIGRFIGSWMLTRVAPWKVLAGNAVAAMVLLVATMTASGSVAMWAVLAVGLFNSVMFPTIFTMAIRGLGTLTAQGSGILCAAIVGGALVPVLQGVVSDRFGLQPGFLIPLFCYGYIVFYAIRPFHRVEA
jgi:FHS family L-fucose permease-like MFS transporter